MQRLSKTRFTSVIPLGEIAPHVPKIVVKVVGKAMEMEPNARYQTPGELLYDLTALSSRLKENASDVDSLAELPDRTVVQAAHGDGGRIEHAASGQVSRALQEQRLSRAGDQQPAPAGLFVSRR